MSTPCTVVIGAVEVLETIRQNVSEESEVLAWASFEIPKGVSRYRAGVEFNDAEVSAIDAFCMRHKS